MSKQSSLVKNTLIIAFGKLSVSDVPFAATIYNVFGDERVWYSRLGNDVCYITRTDYHCFA